MAILHVYFEGCCHGSLNAIYSAVQRLSRSNHPAAPIDLLLIGGDFQALRTAADLNCLAVPAKYKAEAARGDFQAYFRGEKTAPMLTVFIGGNHEASNYLQELYYGGWVAPNIYYLGKSGCVVYKDTVRIAGMSGIYNEAHYRLPYAEKVPFNSSTMRNVYHVRNYEVAKLSLLGDPELNKWPSFRSMSASELIASSETPIDVFMSHDWPAGVEQYGDLKALLKIKPYFKQEVERGDLGSPPAMDLLRTLRPKTWVSAHLHVGFEANVIHGGAAYKHSQPSEAPAASKIRNDDEIVLSDLEIQSDDEPATEIKSVHVRNDDEIVLDDLDEEEPDFAKPQQDDAKKQAPVPGPQSVTNFVAMDKCLPRRKFLKYLPINVDRQPATPQRRSRSPSPQPRDAKKQKLEESTASRASSPQSNDKDLQNSADKFTLLPSEKSLLSYDPAWLAITKSMNPHFPIKLAPNIASTTKPLEIDPNTGSLDTSGLMGTLQTSRAWIQKHVVGKDLLAIPHYEYFFPPTSSSEQSPTPSTSKFWADSDLASASSARILAADKVPITSNPQTVRFCELLEIDNKVKQLAEQAPEAPPQEYTRNNNRREGNGGSSSQGNTRGGRYNNNNTRGRGGYQNRNRNSAGHANHHSNSQQSGTFRPPALPSRPQAPGSAPVQNASASTSHPQYAANSDSE